MDQENKPLFGLSIEGQTASTMSSSAQWARILAICGIIFGSMIVLAGILARSLISRATSMGGYESDTMRDNMALGAGVAMVMYIIMGGLTILGNVFLLNYANRISTALKTNDTASLTSGFAGLRNYCAFWAIIMFICLLFFLIALLTAMASA